jgi:hypothetical protein
VFDARAITIAVTAAKASAIDAAGADHHRTGNGTGR